MHMDGCLLCKMATLFILPPEAAEKKAETSLTVLICALPHICSEKHLDLHGHLQGVLYLFFFTCFVRVQSSEWSRGARCYSVV